MTTPSRQNRPRSRHAARVIDMDRVERNIARIQATCDAPACNRTHIKTPQEPRCWPKLQVAAGAGGITCQKVGEADGDGGCGIDDIL